MRRIASIFVTKRSDKSDASSPGDSKPAPAKTHTLPRQKKPSRLLGTAPRIAITPEHPTPALDQGHSSSSSSSNSGSLRTPDDDRASPMVPPIVKTVSQRSWVPFRPVKKSQPTLSLATTFGITTPSPETLPSRMLNVDTESDYMSESLSSESEAHLPSAPAVSRLMAVEFVTALTSNNLESSFSPPPLLHLPHAPVFPRSSNPSRSLAFRDSFESTMHKKRLLRRLQRRHELLPSEQRSLATFGSRPATAAARRALPQMDEGARLDLKHVEANSRGLKRWVNRPYFEERTTMWVPDEQTGTIISTPVKGSGFGVWALEISESVEILAGVTSDEVQSPHIGMWDPPSSASSTSSQLSAPPTVTSKQPAFKALPSPLRNSGVSFDEYLSTAESSRTVRPVSIPDPVAHAPAPKRGVRFAETKKPDQVPQDYLARVRKQRQEKAKFLQEERERRLHEEQRMKHEAERRQWEMEKEKWEREKRALEEERRKKAYAKEVAAARARRECSYHSLSASKADQRGREARESYSRPAYDPRKQPESPGPRLRNDSPSSSRAYSPSRSSVNGSPLFAPRPTSTHSLTPLSSAEDVRNRDPRPSNSGRGSMISNSSDRLSAYSHGWQSVPIAVSPVPPVPMFPTVQMMPVIPQYAMDIPLLPPTPPFMYQQYGLKPRSPSSSPRQSSARLPHSSSSELIPPGSNTPSRTHHRHSSDEARRNQPSSASPRRGGRGSPAPRPRPASHANSWAMPVPQPSPSTSKPHVGRRQTAFS